MRRRCLDRSPGKTRGGSRWFGVATGLDFLPRIECALERHEIALQDAYRLSAHPGQFIDVTTRKPWGEPRSILE